MKTRKISAVFTIILTIISLFTIISINTLSPKGGQLLTPRFGAPLRTSAAILTPTGGSLEKPITIEIGTAAGANIPRAWLDPENWEIAISSSYLDNSPLTLLSIKSLSRSSGSNGNYGGLESSLLSRNALKIELNVPDNCQAGLYNLHIAFQKELTGQTFTISAGDYIASLPSNSESSGFRLHEANCIYIPHPSDALATDPVGSNSNIYSLTHISDIHVAVSSETDSIARNILELNDLRESLSVWGPEIVVASGDLTNSPDDYPVEYRLAYEYYRSLGLPFLASNGNHDQSNIALFPYYFGPIHQVSSWGGTRFVTMSSTIPPGAETINNAVKSIRDGTIQGKATFFVDHYPLMDVLDREMTYSAGAILDAMYRNNATGVLNGHNHYNLIIDVPKAYKTYYLNQDLTPACDIPENVGNEAPTPTTPKIMIVSSAAKEARSGLSDEGIWEDYQPYLSYRRITIASGHMVNYTYDLNADGIRDPSYAHPTNFSQFGGIKTNLSYDPSNLMAGAEFRIFNNLTEGIPNARAAVVLPKVEGFYWVPTGPLMTLRSTFYNATHQFLDIRVPVDPRNAGNPSERAISLELQAEV